MPDMNGSVDFLRLLTYGIQQYRYEGNGETISSNGYVAYSIYLIILRTILVAKTIRHPSRNNYPKLMSLTRIDRE